MRAMAVPLGDNLVALALAAPPSVDNHDIGEVALVAGTTDIDGHHIAVRCLNDLVGHIPYTQEALRVFYELHVMQGCRSRHGITDDLTDKLWQCASVFQFVHVVAVKDCLSAVCESLDIVGRELAGHRLVAAELTPLCHIPMQCLKCRAVFLYPQRPQVCPGLAACALGLRVVAVVPQATGKRFPLLLAVERLAVHLDDVPRNEHRDTSADTLDTVYPFMVEQVVFALCRGLHHIHGASLVGDRR